MSLHISLKRVNNILLVAVVAINLYVISVPFLPQILFRIDKSQGKQQVLEDSLYKPVRPSGSTTSPTTSPSPPPSGQQPTRSAPAAQGNRLVIPTMLLDQTIVEGTNVAKSLDKGVWRWPGGSTPDKGGNTVLVGHRFTYTKPKGVFYFLDKVHQGDTVGVVWDGKTYIYKVTGTQVVTPNQTSILDPTEESTITIYTCTPLWLPKNRLVVFANLESIQE